MNLWGICLFDESFRSVLWGCFFNDGFWFIAEIKDRANEEAEGTVRRITGFICVYFQKREKEQLYEKVCL